LGLPVLSLAESRREAIVQQIERDLGRELTPREKFYLALSGAVRSNQITVKNARKQRDRELTTE
jgi:hypothetical protein